jgi:NAD(P)-dependent dehydrogenase (short-subunit alcohol dehydrogenase family)
MTATPPSLSLAGLNALIIGGSSGIGETVAHGFLDAGARVAIAARTPGKLEAAVEKLSRRDPAARGYAADVTQGDDLEGLARRAAADLGRIDILMNCQGTTIIKPTLAFTPEEFGHVLATNVTSVFFCCTTFGRLMIEQGGGCIINIASLAAHRGWPRACPTPSPSTASSA